MRLRLHPPAERLFRRLPSLTPYQAAELLLVVLIAVQSVRLALSIATPVDTVDAAAPAAAVPRPDAVLAEFDPFFRASAGGDAAAAIDLKLYGVREDRASGGGSAIIALPDGTQRSFAVGEEIVPGVTLAAVGFDSATVDRNGVGTQIFLDQTRAPQAVTPGAPAAPAASAQSAPATAPNSQILYQERSNGGIAVSPGIDGGYALRAAGLEPGDVIVSINGQPVTSLDQARTITRRARGELPVIVNRGGRAVALRVSLEL